VHTKEKRTQKQSYKTHPLLPKMEATLYMGLLLVIKIKTCTYQLCKRQSADTNALISRYRLSAKWPIPIIGASLLIIINQLIKPTLNLNHFNEIHTKPVKTRQLRLIMCIVRTVNTHLAERLFTVAGLQSTLIWLRDRSINQSINQSVTCITAPLFVVRRRVGGAGTSHVIS